ncbi:hypothetical protein BHE74_00045962 [Ensete ventricosum]|nr:hypothetical protein BHE74_00045962 [Ensete ventricosum]
MHALRKRWQQQGKGTLRWREEGSKDNVDGATGSSVTKSDNSRGGSDWRHGYRPQKARDENAGQGLCRGGRGWEQRRRYGSVTTEVTMDAEQEQGRRGRAGKGQRPAINVIGRALDNDRG